MIAGTYTPFTRLLEPAWAIGLTASVWGVAGAGIAGKLWRPRGGGALRRRDLVGLRPDVIAAAHAHSMYGKSWASLGRLLDPITQDACAFYEDHAVFADYTGVVYETSEGERIAQALGQRKAVILRNHGLLTVGHTVEEAAWWFITMDRSCQAQLLAEAAGTPVKIDAGHAAATREQVGTHLAGWFQLQPLLAKIVREEPDLLE